LSLQVQRALLDVFPSQDALDQEGFDPVGFLDEQFPSEQTLADLDVFLAKTRNQLKRMDMELRKNIREAINMRERSLQGADLAQESISTLYSKVRGVLIKGEQSQRVVEQVSQGAKQLDAAKKNLNATFLAVTQYHTLVNASKELHVLVEQKEYRDVANILSGIDDVLDHFKDFQDVKCVAELKQSVDRDRDRIEAMIQEEFKVFGNFDEEADGAYKETAEASCDVLDILGEGAVLRLISFITKRFFEHYAVRYIESSELRSIDKLDTRFAWFGVQINKFLRHYGEMFPVHWNLPGRIAIEFCLISLFNEFGNANCISTSTLIGCSCRRSRTRLS